eukprot:m51a1_g7964 putative tyrosine-protein kinase transforming protein abl (185) ;mRNA; f:240954-242168
MDTLRQQIAQLSGNDAELRVFQPNPNVWRMKPEEFVPAVASAVAASTVLAELRLVDLGLTDSDARMLAEAVGHNQSVVVLDLSKNRISSDGAVSIAEALHDNTTLKELVLLDNLRFGDPCLNAYVEMLLRNVTLTKITWRLETRMSTKVNAMLTRNKEIERRVKAGKPFDDIDPRNTEAPAQDN